MVQRLLEIGWYVFVTMLIDCFPVLSSLRTLSPIFISSMFLEVLFDKEIFVPFGKQFPTPPEHGYGHLKVEHQQLPQAVSIEPPSVVFWHDVYVLQVGSGPVLWVKHKTCAVILLGARKREKRNRRLSVMGIINFVFIYSEACLTINDTSI